MTKVIQIMCPVYLAAIPLSSEKAENKTHRFHRAQKRKAKGYNFF